MSEKRIGRYIAERVLGAGAFATVWLAYDDILETRVAIKVLADNWARNAGIRQRFVEEARILRRIDHDRIIRVHEINELDDGRPYFVMALADRGTLETRLDDVRTRGERFPLDDALRLTIELCEALAVVHDFGVVHRDIKPSNMLFREVRPHERAAAKRLGIDLGDELVVLGDFGLAKDLAVGDGFTVAAGTPAYMAPEQAQATADIDHRVDVFASTAVLYELLAGTTAFAAGSLSEVRSTRQHLMFTPLSALRDDIPAALDEIIMRGLAANRDERFPDVVSLSDALAAVRSSLGAVRTGSADRKASTPVQGPARRVLELVPVVRQRLAGGATSLLTDAEDRLGRPVRTVIVAEAPHDQLLEACGGSETVSVVSSPDDALVLAADLVIIVGDPGGTDPVIAERALMSAASLAAAGPVHVERLAAPFDEADLDRIRSLHHELAEHRAPLLRAASGLRLLLASADGAASPAARSQILQAVDLVAAELPELQEIEVLRSLVSGKASLARPLAGAVVPLLLFHTPALRLGLAPDATVEQCRSRAGELAETWRVLENTGRIPYSSRHTMLVAQRALDQLQSDLTETASPL